MEKGIVGLDEKYVVRSYGECELCKEKSYRIGIGWKEDEVNEKGLVCESCLEMMREVKGKVWLKVNLDRWLGCMDEDEDLFLKYWRNGVVGKRYFVLDLKESRGNVVRRNEISGEIEIVEKKYEKRYEWVGEDRLREMIKDMLGKEWSGERRLEGYVDRVWKERRYRNRVVLEIEEREGNYRDSWNSGISGRKVVWNDELGEWDFEEEDRLGDMDNVGKEEEEIKEKERGMLKVMYRKE